MRFEKNIDPNLSIIALKRVCHLIEKFYPNAKISKDFIDIKEKEFLPKKLILRISKTNKLLGTKLSFNEIQSIFQRLECETNKKTEDTIEIIPPTYRNDIKKEIDLIEEVARIYGYNNIEKKTPSFSSSLIFHDKFYLFEKFLKNILTSLNLQEIITPNLISENFSKIVSNNEIKIAHAKSKEQSILRSSFLPSFLQVAKNNLYHKNFNLHFFETGKIHFKKDDKIFEENALSIMLSGKRTFPYFEEKENCVNFFDLKGLIENILSKLKIKNFSFKKSSINSFHPKRQIAIFLQDINIGTMGELHPKILHKMDIKKTLFFLEMNLLELFKKFSKKIKFEKFSLFPSSERDLTIKIDSQTPISKILDLIKTTKSNILEKYYLLDIYINPKFPNIKNVTFRFIYRDKTKTISNIEVEKELLKINKKINILKIDV
jgi:phenylalanyl-tRNA synthetase beta chain